MLTAPAFDPAQLPGDVTLDHVIPARSPDTTPLPADLRPEIAAALAGRGVDRLYSHQAEAYAHVRAGRNVVVVTPTASGKTLCYNLPVLQGLMERPDSRALYLFPTKALAQDQLAELGALVSPLPIDVKVAVYDGDTPPGQRTAIREGGHIVLTNPDMLHVGILPNHSAWGDFFANLAAVVVDEAHVYRGVFGSHVGNVLRRLRRAAAIHGTEPRFLLTSATIASPVELAERLTG
ncbi:MAG: ATP-dependent helicase, partial [Candidatus Nephthysia bennettiae]